MTSGKKTQRKHIWGWYFWLGFYPARTNGWNLKKAPIGKHWPTPSITLNFKLGSILGNPLYLQSPVKLILGSFENGWWGWLRITLHSQICCGLPRWRPMENWARKSGEAGKFLENERESGHSLILRIYSVGRWLHKYLPLMLHGDGGAFQRADSIIVLSMRSILSSAPVAHSQMLLVALPKSAVHKSDNPAADTMHCLWAVLTWSNQRTLRPLWLGAGSEGQVPWWGVGSRTLTPWDAEWKWIGKHAKHPQPSSSRPSKAWTSQPIFVLATGEDSNHDLQCQGT